MKNLLRLFASLARFLDPRRVHSIKTGRASGKSCRKSLIINDQILHPPSKSSGNVRFCTFTVTPIPSLSEVIRSFALKPMLQAWQEWKTRTVTPALTGRCNTPQSLHRVALCCSVLHRVSPKNFSALSATPLLSRQSRAGAWWYFRDAPAGNRRVRHAACRRVNENSLISGNSSWHGGRIFYDARTATPNSVSNCLSGLRRAFGRSCQRTGFRKNK